MENNEQSQRIRNVMVAHVLKYQDMYIRPNVTRKEWSLLKDFKAKKHLINYLQIKGQ